jgi:hypothetical protein
LDVASTCWFNWVQRDSIQETLISENRVFIQTNSHGTFLWILMPVSSTLASQELLRLAPKSRSPWAIFSADEGGIAAPQGILTATFSAGLVSRFTSNSQWSLGEGAHAHKWQLPLCHGLGQTPDSVVSNGQGGKQGFGFWPEFIYPVVTSPLLLSTLSP